MQQWRDMASRPGASHHERRVLARLLVAAADRIDDLRSRLPGRRRGLDPLCAILCRDLPLDQRDPLTPLQAIQIGIITEIFGFTSSFIGFFRARLIDFRLGLRTAAVGAPLTLAGVLLAYRIPQAALLTIVALSLPALAWYLRRPVELEPDAKIGRTSPESSMSDESVRAAALRVPLCCYSSSAYYAGAAANAGASVPDALPRPAGDVASESRVHEHRDKSGRVHRVGYRGGPDQFVVGALGGTATGFVGFGIGVLGVTHLVLKRGPMRIAVGTSHFVILFVTGVAVAAHLAEIVSRGQAPPWNVIAVNVTAVLIGGQLAAWLAGRLPEQRMRQVLLMLLVSRTLVTLYRAWMLARM